MPLSPLEPMDEPGPLWDEIAADLRRSKLFRPLTIEEAQAAYDAAVPIPLSPERIEEIVDYVLAHAEPKGSRPE